MKAALKDQNTGGVMIGELSTVPRKTLAYRRNRPDVAVSAAYVRNLYLTERDRNVIAYLGEIGYATTQQIADLFWNHVSRPVKQSRGRLLELWKKHVLDRVPGRELMKYGFENQLVYYLGKAGVRVLREEDAESARARRRSAGLLLAHNALLGEAMVRLSRSVNAARNDLAFRFWGEPSTYTQFTWENQTVKMRPDGRLALFGRSTAASCTDNELIFFAEFDTGTRPVDSYTSKVKQYELYKQSGEWKNHFSTFPAVLVVTWAAVSPSREDADKRRREAALRRRDRALDKVKERSSGGPNRRTRWAFTTLDEIGSGRWKLLLPNDQVRTTDLLG